MFINPCSLGSVAGYSYQARDAMQFVSKGYNAYQDFSDGNYFNGTLDALGALGNVGQFFRACFSGDTKLMARGGWGEGWRRIDEISEGDEVFSRDENDCEGPVEWKKVEEVFRRFGFVMQLQVGGKVIRTTSEHPFYVRDKGWVVAGEMRPGNLVSSHDGQWVAVEEVASGGEYEKLYNLRAADWHTYFVGGEEWGFSVWAHNACNANSARSTATNYGYAIYDKTTGEIFKFGISSSPVNAAGNTYRAAGQVNALNSAGGNFATVNLGTFSNRAGALQWEGYTVGTFRDLGHSLPGNIRPSGIPFAGP
jgi:hypothetical protein